MTAKPSQQLSNMSFFGKDRDTQESCEAPMSGVSRANTDEKPALQQPGAGDTPSNQKASQQFECIVISDSDEESSHVVGRTRSMSVGYRDARSQISEHGDPEEQETNMPSDPVAMLPVQPIRQPTSSRDQCVVCRERAFLEDLHQCGSCDKLLHEGCAASLPVPLSQYCFFCKDCKEQPHQRGALLEALAASGRQGGTVQELRDFVAAREAACMEANTNTTITRLVGAGRTIQAELSQMVRAKDNHQDASFQIEICFENRSISKQRYRLKLGSEDEWDHIDPNSQQAHAASGNSIQEDPAWQPSTDASGRGDTNSSMQAQIQRSAQAAAAEDKAAMPGAEPALMQKLHERSQAQLPQSGKRKGSPNRSQGAVKKKMQKKPSAERLQEMEAEMLQLKKDNLLLCEQLQEHQRQVTEPEPSRVGSKQGISTQRSSTADTADTPDFAEDASAEQSLGILKQVLQSLQKCKPAELGDIPSAQDPKAKHLEELLMALKPQLQGDNIIEWLDASSQLKEPLQELITTQAALDHAVTEVEVSKQLCLAKAEGLSTQLGELCDSWHGWLISIADYERRARDVPQLQHRARVFAQAEQVIRPK